MRKTVAWVAGVLAALGLIALIAWRILAFSGDEAAAEMERGPAPVAVAQVSRDLMLLRRNFSGTLESAAQYTAAPKIAGRIARLTVDLADTVERGQVIAELDPDEYRLALEQAQAALAVAQANLTAARSAAEIARRELERVSTLNDRGVASASQLDVAESEQLAAAAQVAGTEAQLEQAQAAVGAARVRLGYATIRARWQGGSDQRVVGQTYVEQGDTVAANAPLMSIVQIDPIQAVIYVTERDYADLAPGQEVTLSTDAYPGETFSGVLQRVAPVFNAASRQARVEIKVDNPQRKLKPGMFISASTILRRIEDAQSVPAGAVVRRDERPVVFTVNPEGTTASLVEVEVGIQDAGRIQIIEPALEGPVVTLGQQLVEDGGAVVIAQDQPGEAASRRADAAGAGGGAGAGDARGSGGSGDAGP